MFASLKMSIFLKPSFEQDDKHTYVELAIIIKSSCRFKHLQVHRKKKKKQSHKHTLNTTSHNASKESKILQKANACVQPHF